MEKLIINICIGILIFLGFFIYWGRISGWYKEGGFFYELFKKDSSKNKKNGKKD